MSAPVFIPSLECCEREYSPSSCIGGDYEPCLDAYVRHSWMSDSQLVVYLVRLVVGKH